MTDTPYQNYPGATSSVQQYEMEKQRREAEQRQLANMDAAQKEHSLEVGAIVEQGRDHFGKDEFDDASETVSKAFGERVGALTYALRGFDSPDKIVMELAKRGDTDLKHLARSTDTRLLAELGRVQGVVAPGQTHSSEMPAWKNIGPRGQVTRDTFESGASDNLSDERWSKAFNKHSRLGRMFSDWKKLEG